MVSVMRRLIQDTGGCALLCFLDIYVYPTVHIYAETQNNSWMSSYSLIVIGWSKLDLQ
jgi:hypothetical protein